MTLNLDKEFPGEIFFDYEKTAERVINAALDWEACPYEAEVSLVLTTDEDIRSANAQFRNIDRVTDVLSFPMVDFETPGDFSILEDMENAFDPDSGELVLGDIMIAIPRMREQAESYGHGEIREYAFLIAHSMLHLMGYDHMTEAEASVMEEKQEAILEQLGIRR
ncbi:MAG: rRNA maturation RNase YbeY [Blautia sp.]